MKTHIVQVNGSMAAHQFQVNGTARPEVEAILIETINHFYEVTGRLSDTLGKSRVYSVYLDNRGGNNYSSGDRIHFNPANLTAWTITHELAHALDAANGWKLSQQMKAVTGSGFRWRALHYLHPEWEIFWYRVGSPPPPCGIDKRFNSLEDFAETVTAYIYPDAAKRKANERGYPYEKWGYVHFHDTPRGMFFKQLLDLAERNNALV